MASMRDLKRRRESILATEQITKAMKLVATVKLQKARDKAESSRPYTSNLLETMKEILMRTSGIQHPYLTERAEGRTAVILITSNRGLAGGYNMNVIRPVFDHGFDPEHTLIYTVGRKGREAAVQKGYKVSRDLSDIINAPLYKDALVLTEELLKDFSEKKIREIWLAYTEFKNTVSHIPRLIRLLPVTLSEEEEVEKEAEAGKAPEPPMNFEPDDETVLESLIPQYLSSVLYGAFLQCVASENGARMTAMDAATDNAEEMIEKLQLQYNRARQGSITQELTEIIAGKNAIQ